MGINDASNGLRRLLIHRLGGARASNGGDGSGPDDPLRRRLQACEREIERLRVENEHLRMSAATFGELAERLNRALKQAGRARTPIPKG